MSPMRRWLLIVLLLVMPFQTVWAVVAPYCGHETQSTAQHFGHHEHKHAAGGAEQGTAALPGADMDCGACHLVSPATVPAALLVAAPPPTAAPVEFSPSHYTSRVPSGPEKPQRHAASPTVRFVSGVVSSLTT